MYKYGGLLIYQMHDDDGLLEVVDDAGIRSLHFGSSSKQSSQLLSEPSKLVLDYVRAMACWQLFKPVLEENVLMIGLGAGTISKYLLQNFPASFLTVIEYRKSVVKIARSHFGLPFDNRLKIIVADGGDYVCRVANNAKQFGLLIIDAFDHEGVAASVRTLVFFQAAKSLLTNNGILVINLWGGTANPQFQEIAQWLGQCFNWKTLFLPVQNGNNIIVFAFNDPTNLYSMSELRVLAMSLEQSYQIEFPTFLKNIKKHNASTLKEIIKL